MSDNDVFLFACCERGWCAKARSSQRKSTIHISQGPFWKLQKRISLETVKGTASKCIATREQIFIRLVCDSLRARLVEKRHAYWNQSSILQFGGNAPRILWPFLSLGFVLAWLPLPGLSLKIGAIRRFGPTFRFTR